MSLYRWNEPGIQTVHAVLCTTGHDEATRIAEQVIDALKARGWKPPATTILEKSYEGFESWVDIGRDVDECFDSRFNPAMKNIDGESDGTMKVTITFEP